MATVTRLKLGPADHGRALSYDDFRACDWEEGYQYELIDGRLYVTPQAALPQELNEEWLSARLRAYARRHPEVINWVTQKARVFVPERLRVTAPEPDVTAYHNFPLDQDFNTIDWQDVQPVLVAEILSVGDPNKDLVRNVELYFQVPRIKEYWVLDTREDANRPTLRAHRRHGKRWRILDLAYRATYTTPLLPGFKLVIDPRRR